MSTPAQTNFYLLLVTDPEAALRDVMARRELHRALKHRSMEDDDFFDCSGCGVLDRQLQRAEEATK